MISTNTHLRLVAAAKSALIRSREELNERTNRARQRKDHHAEEARAGRAVQAVRDLLNTKTITDPRRTIDAVRKLAHSVTEEQDTKSTPAPKGAADGRDKEREAVKGVRKGKSAQIDLHPKTVEGGPNRQQESLTVEGGEAGRLAMVASHQGEGPRAKKEAKLRRHFAAIMASRKIQKSVRKLGLRHP